MDTSAMETSYAGVKGMFRLGNLKLLCLEKSPKYGIMDRTIGGHDHKEGIIQKKDLQNFMPDSQTESFQTVVKKVKCPRCKKGKKLKCWRCVSARPKALAADHIFLSKEKTEICTQLEPLLKPLCTLSFETNATRRNIHDLEEEVSAKIQSNRKLAKAKERLKRTINEQSNVSKSVKDHLPVVIGQRAKNQKNTAMLDEEYCRVKKRQSKEIYRRMLVVMNKVFPMEKLDRAIVNRPPPEELEKQRLIREAGGKDIPIDYTVLLDVKRLQFTDMYRICCCTIPEVENLDFLKCELGKVNQSMHKEAVEQLAALNYIVQMVEKLSECIGYVLPYEVSA
uniref:Retrotransposon gag protein n=1 Tax=Rhabditophanes sp. KR3021 TaxID=114890 RepID=A0AC35U3E4_9BILA